MTTAPWLPPVSRTGAPRAPAPAAPRWRRRTRRLYRRARRPVGALLLAVAVLLGVRAVAVPPAEGSAADGVAVVVTTRDLPAGASLAGATEAAHRARDAVPRGALAPEALDGGEHLAGPVRAGEVITDVRLAGSALVASLAPGELALPVAVATPLPEGLVGPGARVSVLAAGLDDGWVSDAGGASGGGVLVDDAAVLSVSSGSAAEGLLSTGTGSTVVVLALDPDDAAAVAAAASSRGVVLAVTAP